MDLTINASFSSTVSAITLDEAIRASSQRRLDVKTQSHLRSYRRRNAAGDDADAVATSTTTTTTDRATGSSLPHRYIGGIQERDTMRSPQPPPQSPSSRRHLYKDYSERSELSFSTIRTDEGDGEGDDNDDDDDDVSEDPLALYNQKMQGTVGRETRRRRSSSSAAAADDDDVDVNNFHPDKRVSRFDLVCPRRGSDEILIPPRHDLFDDDDDDDKEIEQHGSSKYDRKVRLNDVHDDDEDGGAIERDSDMTGQHRYGRAMLPSSLPTKMFSRPWTTEERKKIGRRRSGDTAPTLPRSSRERERSRVWDQTGKDTAPKKPRSRSLDDYEDDPSPNMSNGRENNADLKRFVSANLPLMKPTRQLTIDWNDNPAPRNDTFQRFEGLYPDAMKAVRASVLPVPKPVRQNSVGLCRPGGNADDQPNNMDTESRPSDEDKSFDDDVDSMGFKPIISKMVHSKAILEDSCLAETSMHVEQQDKKPSPVKKTSTRMSAIRGSTRRRSLGPLCTVSPKSMPKRMRGTDAAFKRSQLDTATDSSLGFEGECVDARQDVLDGDEYNPPVPKKIRRHSTPWMSKSGESDGAKKAFNGAAKNVLSTPCFERYVAAAAAAAMTVKNCDPSNLPTPSVPPPSPSTSLTLTSVTEQLKGDKAKSSSRFDPLGGSNHSIDVMVMMKPPSRQASNRELLNSNDISSPTQDANRKELCLQNNSSFADLSSPVPPKMPKRQESFPEMYSMSSDKEDEEDDYD